MASPAQGASTPSSTGRPRSFFARNSTSQNETPENEKSQDEAKPTKWSMGVMNDPYTHEVPGSVLLLTGKRNEPLGLRNAPARQSHGSLPAAPSMTSRRPEKKTTKDGAIILNPQPEDSANDPLNWPNWRRDAALLSLGLYCMVGGGMTPILAAGFTNVAATYDVTTAQVALTTGLYMMGMGVGSVFASPTAILFGKRPVYLVSAVMFIATSVWCASSPSYISLLVARIFQGMSVSPVECLPSATIAEIFFLHERAYRLGIYTLLLLGGKNLVPLVSAAIIQSFGWRWVFWIVAMVVGLCGTLLFLFVPETYWDRSPVPKSRRTSKSSGIFARYFSPEKSSSKDLKSDQGVLNDSESAKDTFTTHSGNHFIQRPEQAQRRESTRGLHVGFPGLDTVLNTPQTPEPHNAAFSEQFSESTTQMEEAGTAPLPDIHNFNSPYYEDLERRTSEDKHENVTQQVADSAHYTAGLRDRPRVTFVQQLKPYNGRMHYDNWFKVALRPFILFCYPAVLWSAIVYSCSVGWLIVLSESVSLTYRSKHTYNFSALSTGLIYISPFIGGVLGTAVAGKVSDVIVKAMSKRNGGLYEPEFRLVMAVPITITTVIGLMGFGWSAEVHDHWIVPTIFFGVISFGCSLGSTTAITFCVDSYRQYAGEALVTLNFSKNIFHGLVFSLFFPNWLESDGSKIVFISLGVIQLVLMLLTIPMYIFGKRFRMWTVRKNLMEKF